MIVPLGLSKLTRFLPDPSPRERGRPQPNTTTYPTRESIETAPRPLNDLNIHLSEHWAIVARTGRGKTYFTINGLLAYLRSRYPHAKRYLLDSTEDPKIPEYLGADALFVEGDRAPDLLHDPRKTLVWRPTHSKIPLHYTEWFQRLNDSHEEQIIVIDEVKSITKQASDELETLLKQSRKHGGTVICCSQQIVSISPLMSQITHFVQFSLNPIPYDWLQARTFLGVAKEDQKMPRSQFGFFYRRMDSDQVVQEYHDMSDFFKGAI